MEVIKIADVNNKNYQDSIFNERFQTKLNLRKIKNKHEILLKTMENVSKINKELENSLIEEIYEPQNLFKNIEEFTLLFKEDQFSENNKIIEQIKIQKELDLLSLLEEYRNNHEVMIAILDKLYTYFTEFDKESEFYNDFSFFSLMLKSLEQYHNLVLSINVEYLSIENPEEIKQYLQVMGITIRYNQIINVIIQLSPLSILKFFNEYFRINYFIELFKFPVFKFKVLPENSIDYNNPYNIINMYNIINLIRKITVLDTYKQIFSYAEELESRDFINIINDQVGQMEQIIINCIEKSNLIEISTRVINFAYYSKNENLENLEKQLILVNCDIMIYTYDFYCIITENKNLKKYISNYFANTKEALINMLQLYPNDEKFMVCIFKNLKNMADFEISFAKDFLSNQKLINYIFSYLQNESKLYLLKGDLLLEMILFLGKCLESDESLPTVLLDDTNLIRVIFSIINFSIYNSSNKIYLKIISKCFYLIINYIASSNFELQSLQTEYYIINMFNSLLSLRCSEIYTEVLFFCNILLNSRHRFSVGVFENLINSDLIIILVEIFKHEDSNSVNKYESAKNILTFLKISLALKIDGCWKTKITNIGLDISLEKVLMVTIPENLYNLCEEINLRYNEIK